MPIAEHTIESIIELFAALKEHCVGPDFLFRGQREDRPLLPRIARLSFDPGDRRPDAERRMYEDFRRQALPFLERVPDNDWDWLALAQHHGMATRLLDWTGNPLVAMWFAVARPAVDSGSAVIWILEIESADYVEEKETVNPWSVDRTRVFRPTHITRRVVAQSGWFTVHKYRTKSENFLALDKNSTYKRRLRKLRIPATAFADIRWDLDRCGINGSSLFPELDGLCQHIEWTHSLLKDETESPAAGSPRRARA